MRTYWVPAMLAVVGLALIITAVPFTKETTLTPAAYTRKVAGLTSIASKSDVVKKSGRDDSRLEAAMPKSISASIAPSGARELAEGTVEALNQIEDWVMQTEWKEREELDRLIEQYADFESGAVFERAAIEARDRSLWQHEIELETQKILVNHSEDETKAFSVADKAILFSHKIGAFELYGFKSTEADESTSVSVHFQDGSKLTSRRNGEGSYWSFTFPDGRNVYRFLNPDGTRQYEHAP